MTTAQTTTALERNPAHAWSLVNSPWRRYWRWVWLVAFAGGLVFVVRDVDVIQETAITIGVLHRPVAAVIVGLLIVPVALKRLTVPFRRLVGLLTVFALWRLTSTIWSPEPAWTLYRSFEYLTIVVLTAYTAASIRSVKELREWMNWVWAWTGLMVASVWIGLAVAPTSALRLVSDVPGVAQEAVLPVMLQGVFPVINPNGVATFGAVLTLVAVARVFGGARRKNIWIALIVIGMITMLMAQSRSAIAGFVLGFALILILYRKVGWIAGLGLGALAASFTYSSDALLWDLIRRGQSLELFGALSGRTVIWELAWDQYIREHLWFGVGAFVGARFLVASAVRRDGAVLSGMENAWIDVGLDLGVFGVVLLVIVVVWTSAILLRSARISEHEEKQTAIEMAGVLALVVFRAFFTSALVLHNSWYFFLAVGCATYLQGNTRGPRGKLRGQYC